jgi:hypothetical protein
MGKLTSFCTQLISEPFLIHEGARPGFLYGLHLPPFMNLKKVIHRGLCINMGLLRLHICSYQDLMKQLKYIMFSVCVSCVP